MKIVVFSDGTGNSSAKLFRTNVWRLYEALDLCDNSKQVAFYDNGVGTASFVPLALLGGAFGFGLKRNVRDIYRFICRNAAKPGEHQIYTFGFSRGAFTIRVLLGLIERQGLVPYHGDDRELTRLATWAYREYRREALPGGRIVKTFRWIRDTALRFFEKRVRRGVAPYTSAHNRRDVRVAFAGLWDTVAAYGFPIVEMTRGWDRWVWPLNLPARELGQQVDKACHALALDDERQTFHPLLWNEKHEPTVWRRAPEGSHEIGTIADERVSQVWFSGMHSNVGGGYPDDGMAYEPLCWIAEQAADDGNGRGLLLKSGTLEEWKQRCSPSAPMSDSRSGVGAYYRYLPRLVSALAKDHEHEVEIDRPKIHASVLQRIKARIDGYAPIVLPHNYVVTDGKNIFELPARTLGPEYVVETSHQAEERFAHQEQVWDAVWYRRIAYFLTVGVTIATLALVLLPDSINARILPWAFPTVSGTIALLAGMLPAAAAPLFEHFVTYPSQLVAGGLAALLLMQFSSFVERRNSDSMRKIWAQQPPPAPSAFLRFARRVRKSDWYVRALDHLRYRIAPNVFGVLMLLLIVVGVAIVTIRVSFDVPMILGQVCKDVANPPTPTTETLRAPGVRPDESVPSDGRQPESGGDVRALRRASRGAMERPDGAGDDVERFQAGRVLAGGLGLLAHDSDPPAQGDGLVRAGGSCRRLRRSLLSDYELDDRDHAADRWSAVPVRQRRARDLPVHVLLLSQQQHLHRRGGSPSARLRDLSQTAAREMVHHEEGPVTHVRNHAHLDRVGGCARRPAPGSTTPAGARR